MHVAIIWIILVCMIPVVQNRQLLMQDILYAHVRIEGLETAAALTGNASIEYLNFLEHRVTTLNLLF